MIQVNDAMAIKNESECLYGIYKLFWVINGQPQPINRLLDTDNSGLLYIGGTKSVQGRLDNFRNSAFRRGTNHTAGKKYREGKLNRFISEGDIYAEVKYFHNALELERELLLNYRRTFGEIPPLNG